MPAALQAHCRSELEAGHAGRSEGIDARKVESQTQSLVHAGLLILGYLHACIMLFLFRSSNANTRALCGR